MQVSIKWLHDYIDFHETAEELADAYTIAGVPVENVVRADAGLAKVVTGRIEELRPNPDSDHLLVCRMNVGEKEQITVQTGADNVHEGDIVPVALVGAHLPNGLKISKGKMRGIVSNGMLCSAGELKLDETMLTQGQAGCSTARPRVEQPTRDGSHSWTYRSAYLLPTLASPNK